MDSFIGIFDTEIKYDIPNSLKAKSSSYSILDNDSEYIDIPFENYVIRKYSTNAIEVFQDGHKLPSAKAELRKIAEKLGIKLLNGTGTDANTRKSGQIIIEHLLKLKK